MVIPTRAAMPRSRTSGRRRYATAPGRGRLTIPRHTVSVTVAGREPITLPVVPPDTPTETAWTEMHIAATSPGTPQTSLPPTRSGPVGRYRKLAPVFGLAAAMRLEPNQKYRCDYRCPSRGGGLRRWVRPCTVAMTMRPALAGRQPICWANLTFLTGTRRRGERPCRFTGARTRGNGNREPPGWLVC